jgi:ribA/ribD-fused uncharacterized protein
MTVIGADGFTGDYRFLSNFWECPFELEGIRWPTSEHAFQAAKAVTIEDIKDVLECVSPGAAKRMGRKITMRADWDSVKLEAMRTVLAAKFTNPDLRQKLLETGDAQIVEGNNWNDRFWGVCRGTGQNHLGKLLMELRAKTKNHNEPERNKP